MRKEQVYKILKDYEAGKLGKYEAMAELDVDNLHELFALRAELNVPVSVEPDHFQSSGADVSVESYFADE